MDKALELLAPGQGARQRKRLLLSGAVRVDGRSCSKGYLVRTGQCISLENLPSLDTTDCPDALPEIVARTDLFAGVLKNAHVHSQSLESGGSPALDACLPALFPDSQAELLNRLDYLTSGLLLVALTASAGDIYRRRQDAGEVYKHYFALVHGRLESGFIAANALDVAKRRKVKVLKSNDGPLRQSVVRPLLAGRFSLYGTDSWRTLVHVRIQKGARHQIRAHLAASGHPIVGDPLYGRDADFPLLYLHHFCIRFSEFSADARPAWVDLPEAFQKKISESAN